MKERKGGEVGRKAREGRGRKGEIERQEGKRGRRRKEEGREAGRKAGRYTR